jgi:hypothetical protein
VACLHGLVPSMGLSAGRPPRPKQKWTRCSSLQAGSAEVLCFKSHSCMFNFARSRISPHIPFTCDSPASNLSCFCPILPWGISIRGHDDCGAWGQELQTGQSWTRPGRSSLWPSDLVLPPPRPTLSRLPRPRSKRARTSRLLRGLDLAHPVCSFSARWRQPLVLPERGSRAANFMVARSG